MIKLFSGLIWLKAKFSDGKRFLEIQPPITFLLVEKYKEYLLRIKSIQKLLKTSRQSIDVECRK